MPASACELISALNHPVRRRILRAYTSPGGAELSASNLAGAMGLRLANVVYHLRILTDLGVLTQTRWEPVRGAREVFYAVDVDGHEDCMRQVLDDCRDGDEALAKEEAQSSTPSRSGLRTRRSSS
jgi:DNA-binding transcriptional ArsR family regulator